MQMLDLNSFLPRLIPEILGKSLKKIAVDLTMDNTPDKQVSKGKEAKYRVSIQVFPAIRTDFDLTKIH